MRVKVEPWSSQDWLIAAAAYPGVYSMKRLEVFLLPLDGMHRRSLPRNLLGFPQQFAGTHLYTWVERGIVKVKNHTRPGLEPGPLVPESSALPMRSLHLPYDDASTKF